MKKTLRKRSGKMNSSKKMRNNKRLGGKSAKSAKSSARPAKSAKIRYEDSHAHELLSAKPGVTQIDPSKAEPGQTYIVEFRDKRTRQAQTNGISNRYVVIKKKITTQEIDIIDLNGAPGTYTETKVTLTLRPAIGGSEIEVSNWASTEDTELTSVGYGTMIFVEP